MTTYEAFLSRVLIEVPGCSEISALLAVKDACVEFCEKSLVITRDHDPVTISANVIDYNLSPPAGYLVAKVMKAWVENNEIFPLVPDFVRDASTYNQLFSSYEAAPSTPTRFVQKEERSITLWPVPDKQYSNGLTMRVALKPSRASTGIEDVVYEDYAEVIAAGALKRLHLSFEKPYTDERRAGLKQAEFMAGVNVARQKVARGHTRANLAVRMRRP